MRKMRGQNDGVLLRLTRMGHHYRCSYQSVKYGAKPCLSISGVDLDQIVENNVLSVLKSPPLDVLREALEESRRREEIESAHIQAERERLQYQVKRATERFENADPKYHRVYHDLQEQVEKKKEELEKFEDRQAKNPLRSRIDGSEEELKELCDLAAQVPRIWHHPSVTPYERKEIIACLIEKVSVTATKETVEGTIHWKAGGESQFRYYRMAGKYNLIKELHTEGCHTKEILHRLKMGENSTRQKIHIGAEQLYKRYKKLGLKAHTKASWYRPLQEEAARLRDQGILSDEIAKVFNSRGAKSLSGKLWTRELVQHLFSGIPRGPDALEQIHWEALSDAKRKGLSNRLAAIELNEKNIPRANGHPWNKDAVLKRWKTLNRRRKIAASNKTDAG